MSATRVQVVAATITTVGSLIAATIGIIPDVVKDPEPASSTETCLVIVDRTLDFAEEHPEAAAEYARSGKADLPSLGDESEVERCGDPEELLERLAESSD